MGMMELLILLGVVLPTALVAGVPIYFVRRYLKLREREVAALEARKPGGADHLRLEEENRGLRQRVEQLEAIVTASDFELNRKLAALEVPGQAEAVAVPAARRP